MYKNIWLLFLYSSIFITKKGWEIELLNSCWNQQLNACWRVLSPSANAHETRRVGLYQTMSQSDVALLVPDTVGYLFVMFALRMFAAVRSATEYSWMRSACRWLSRMSVSGIHRTNILPPNSEPTPEQGMEVAPA